MWRFTKQSLYLIYKAGDNLVENDGIEFAGYLTFLSLLALFPFMVLLVATAGFIGEGELGLRFITFLANSLPDDAVMAIQPRIVEIISGPPQGLLTVSILGALWTSSSAVEGIRAVLNRAYQVSNPPTYIFRRAMSMLQILLFVFIIMVTMFIIVISPFAFEKFKELSGQSFDAEFAALWQQYFLYIGSVILFFFISSVYFFLPNIRMNLTAVLPGAAVAVLMWLGGARLFTWYVANVDQMNIIYGSLGGFIATMLFFFLMNLILIYGAEFNNLIARALGHAAEEKEHIPESEEVEEAHFSETGQAAAKHKHRKPESDR
jgi:membrane protein